jgi:hypothetical protein
MAERITNPEQSTPLAQDDIVYLVDGSGSMGGDDPCVVKKATIGSTAMPNGAERQFPVVLLWRHPGEDPHRSGMAVSAHPRQLFTGQAVLAAIREQQAGLDGRTVDELVADPSTNFQLVDVLGAAVMQRLMHDERTPA